MICDINPLVISSITYKKAKRIGYHPYYLKIMRKKKPISGFFGFYNQCIFDCFYKAEVQIRGSDGSILKIITCSSNDRAKELCDDLTKRIETFLSQLKKDFE